MIHDASAALGVSDRSSVRSARVSAGRFSHRPHLRDLALEQRDVGGAARIPHQAQFVGELIAEHRPAS
jgi:hypothetical protein